MAKSDDVKRDIATKTQREKGEMSA